MEQCKAEFSGMGRNFEYFSLKKLEERGYAMSRIPYSIRILIESALRNMDGLRVTEEHVKTLASYDGSKQQKEISFVPSRVLLQDFTGVPCVVDLAAMRSAMQNAGGDPARINPRIPVDLVIDHSVQVDSFNSPHSFEENAAIEFARNKERYEFLRWGQSTFKNFRVVPPASGICHQVNLEYLAKVVHIDERGAGSIYFDSVIGTDSHTTMINGLGVLGWGVGGIEAEAAMLGQPLYMLTPEVVGFELSGMLKEGVTATDLVLTVTQMLRAEGVVSKFVEFCGSGLASMSIPDRATISNMAPEYGATVGYFPIDKKTLEYLEQTGRDFALIEMVEAYAEAQGMFCHLDTPRPHYKKCLHLDLASVQPSIAGPKRPQDRIALANVKETWKSLIRKNISEGGYAQTAEGLKNTSPVMFPDGTQHALRHGDVVIAAITSCTNTSNPSVLLAAGLLAKKAYEKGLRRKAWVKTSFAPGSMVVTDYLRRCGLMESLEQLGFYLVGYGCTTCIGNSGPLPEHTVKAIVEGDIVAASVLSGNRNFEGRVNPHTRANFLMSPPLVVAYALIGTVIFDPEHDSIGKDTEGKEVYLKDIWPEQEELQQLQARALSREEFKNRYAGIEGSNEAWNAIKFSDTQLYEWGESSYINEPPFFEGMQLLSEKVQPIENARMLVRAGDSVTTDHISPAGAISPDSPAGAYLSGLGISREDFNSYGSRRGNDNIMTRGTFANIRFRNLLAPDTEGSVTVYLPTKEVMSIYDAAERYKEKDIPTIVCAGKDYGMGSSRDWAAKGVMLLGVKAVIAESIERIHRSNLIGMGVLPLQFLEGETLSTLGLSGEEKFTIFIDDSLQARQHVKVKAVSEKGIATEFSVLCRIDSPVEIEYFRNGGILQSVLRSFATAQ